MSLCSVLFGLSIACTAVMWIFLAVSNSPACSVLVDPAFLVCPLFLVFWEWFLWVFSIRVLSFWSLRFLSFLAKVLAWALVGASSRLAFSDCSSSMS